MSTIGKSSDGHEEFSESIAARRKQPGLVVRCEAATTCPQAKLAAPESLENIVHMAAAEAPDDRYQTANEFGDDLGWFLDGKFTIVLTGLVLGFGSRTEAHRPSVTAYALSSLIVLLVCLVIDLDRPRRGWIEVSQDSLISLQEIIHQDAEQGRSLQR